MVGLAEAVVRESRERVRSALLTSGFTFPAGRITVNLSPADLPKEGGRFDLPIAVGILAASGQLRSGTLAGREFYGELGLNGELRETPKLLPALLAGLRDGCELIIPAANALEAGSHRRPADQAGGALAAGLRCLGGPGSAVRRGQTPGPAAEFGSRSGRRARPVCRQARLGNRCRRCARTSVDRPSRRRQDLACAAAARLLPPLGKSEALEVASLESAAGRRPGLDGGRPFRSPQHTASMAALIGGGAFRPGELSLAHLGVLFLDELPEFPRNALEALREPLESGVVKLSRARRSYEFPARFQLIAAMNPCPCGYAGDPRGRCRCSAPQVVRYRHRLSGPLIDRIDIHVELSALPVEHLLDDRMSAAETSAAVAARVAAARKIQLKRQGKLNSHLTAAELAALCGLEPGSRALLGTAIARLRLSARAYHRVLKLARTCADWPGSRGSAARTYPRPSRCGCLDRSTC